MVVLGGEAVSHERGTPVTPPCLPAGKAAFGGHAGGLGASGEQVHPQPQKGRYKATWKREFKHPGREAGPPNHLDDKVDSDQ